LQQISEIISPMVVVSQEANTGEEVAFEVLLGYIEAL
jgi:hypothetical protein